MSAMETGGGETCKLVCSWKG